MSNNNPVWGDIKAIPCEQENVTKFVFTKEDAVAEAVLYRYPTYAKRTVVCCSTQSGCPMGCRFCGAGDNFVRNLTAEEIASQPMHLLQNCVDGVDPRQIEKLQIMFMSMGEPMFNVNGMTEALRNLYRMYPNASLLVSTAAPNVPYDWFFALVQEIPTIGLQFSVHESTDEARNQLIPFKAKLTLAEIAEQGQRFFDVTGRERSPFINYCVHEGNNSDADVDRLVALFDPTVFKATISVVCERNDGLSVDFVRQEALAVEFSEKMVQQGYDVRVFNPNGQDTIGGGCGQLWYTQNWFKENSDKARPSCGNTHPVKHAVVLG